MDEVTYETICDKLGFDVDTYEPLVGDTEDDSAGNPFAALTIEELDFLTNRIQNKQSA
jgi:hypothetical protein